MASARPADYSSHNSSSSSAPLHLSLVESSASDRAYGTFEASLIDVESDDGDEHHDSISELLRHDKRLDDDGDDDAAREIHGCGGGLCHSQDCCFLMAFLCAPIRLRTYQALLFHVANFLFAALASAWTIALLAVELVAMVVSSSSWRAFARRFESSTLRTLLQVDTALFNFVSPLDEHVKVYISSTSSPSDGGVVFFGLQTQLYFAIAKLACSAVPGAIAASMFLWSVQRLLVIALCALSSDSSSCDAVAFDVSEVAGSGAPRFLTTAAQDLDLLVLLALLAVYGTTMLLQVFAYISRHVTIFFCSEHLRLATAV